MEHLFENEIQRLGKIFFGHVAQELQKPYYGANYFQWWIGDYIAPDKKRPLAITEENELERILLAEELAGKFKDFLLDQNIDADVLATFTFIRVRI